MVYGDIMKLFFFVTKKGLFVALALILVIFTTASRAVSLKMNEIDGSTYEKRLFYINSLGYSVEDKTVTTKETVIPANFGDVYSNYNEIQREAGFDLARFKGKRVTVYTYDLCDSEKKLNLIVYDGKIIGGDICDISLNGEMKPLKSYSLN